MPDVALLVGPLDRVLYFRTLPAMDRLSAGHLAAIASHAREQFFPRESTLIGAGVRPEAFFLVVDGQVEVERLGAREAVVGPGEAIGLVPLLARSPVGYQAIAAENTLTLRLDWQDHLDVCELHFPIVEHYLRFVSTQTLAYLRENPDLLSRPRGDGGGGDQPAVPIISRRLDVAERLLALSQSRVFPVESPDAVNELARHVVEVAFGPGQTLWRRGDPAEDFLVVLQGTIECRVGETGRVMALGAGQPLGVEEALGIEPRWYDLVATSAGRALRIGLAPLYDIMEDHFDLAVDFLALRAGELLRAQAMGQPRS